MVTDYETMVTDLKLCMKIFIGTIITISNVSEMLSEYRKPKTYIGIFLAFNLYITVYGTHHTQNSYHQLHDNYFGQAFEPELGVWSHCPSVSHFVIITQFMS